MVTPCNFVLFFFYLLVLKLHDPPAFEAEEVIVMVPPQATLIQAVSPIEVVDLQEIVLG